MRNDGDDDDDDDFVVDVVRRSSSSNNNNKNKNNNDNKNREGFSCSRLLSKKVFVALVMVVGVLAFVTTTTMMTTTTMTDIDGADGVDIDDDENNNEDLVDGVGVGGVISSHGDDGNHHHHHHHHGTTRGTRRRLTGYNYALRDPRMVQMQMANMQTFFPPHHRPPSLLSTSSSMTTTTTSTTSANMRTTNTGTRKTSTTTTTTAASQSTPMKANDEKDHQDHDDDGRRRRRRRLTSYNHVLRDPRTVQSKIPDVVVVPSQTTTTTPDSSQIVLVDHDGNDDDDDDGNSDDGRSHIDSHGPSKKQKQKPLPSYETNDGTGGGGGRSVDGVDDDGKRNDNNEDDDDDENDDDDHDQDEKTTTTTTQNKNAVQTVRDRIAGTMFDPIFSSSGGTVGMTATYHNGPNQYNTQALLEQAEMMANDHDGEEVEEKEEAVREAGNKEDDEDEDDDPSLSKSDPPKSTKKHKNHHHRQDPHYLRLPDEEVTSVARGDDDREGDVNVGEERGHDVDVAHHRDDEVVVLSPEQQQQLQYLQQEEQEQEEQQQQPPLPPPPPFDPLDHQIPSLQRVRILALGGSTTWGSKLEDPRHSAYPYRLAQMNPGWSVTNLAVRATGAFYASQCIETMIREHGHYVVSSTSAEGGGGGDTEPAEGGDEHDDDDDDGPDPEFDIILLEYSMNGLQGMELLLHRLRRRFPRAIVVYVHLWSLRMNVDNGVTGERPRDVLSTGVKFTEADAIINRMLDDSPPDVWAWSPSMMAESLSTINEARNMLQRIGGVGAVYELPRPTLPSTAIVERWFGADYHHLSDVGHHIVAEGIQGLVEGLLPTLQLPAQNVGTWGMGDTCYSWYETGHVPNGRGRVHGGNDHNGNGNGKGVTFQGGTMKLFVKPDKWALQVGQRFGSAAKMEFDNPRSDSLPVELMLMSWGPGIYPRTKLELQSSTDDDWMIIDPLKPNPLDHVFHVTQSLHVGWATPGRNSLTIEPLEETQRPLRVVGIVLCGACMEMDPTYFRRNEIDERQAAAEMAALANGENDDHGADGDDAVSIMSTPHKQVTPVHPHDVGQFSKPLKPTIWEGPAK